MEKPNLLDDPFSEILAHLEFMKRRGRVDARADDGGALYWTAVA